MQRGFRIVIAIVVVLAILAFMTTYTVRFTEKAVVTTFGRADGSSVKTEPGLGIKWPYPIQSVITYDTRQRFTETKSETLATADNRQVILQTYLVWRVNDPLLFFRSYGNGGAREIDHVRQAEETLRAKLRSALAETSRYRLTDLLNAGQGGSKLGDLETGILKSLQGDTAGGGGGGASGALAASGIEAVSVGIQSMELPQAVTEAVFKNMQATQEKLAAAEGKRGQTEADTIKNKADADAQKIQAFAQRTAEVIKGQGQQEAAVYLAMQKEDPRLAVFLQQLRFLREATGHRTTLVLPLSMAGFQLLNPRVQEQLSNGTIPPLGGAPVPPADLNVRPGATDARDLRVKPEQEGDRR
ncbi:MAG TPA: SPFH domain-containing protein [Phycisphaerales bacterium]|nr:SPFH domain-containing protein [Phycisphaerales bacterium]